MLELSFSSNLIYFQQGLHFIKMLKYTWLKDSHELKDPFLSYTSSTLSNQEHKLCLVVMPHSPASWCWQAVLCGCKTRPLPRQSCSYQLQVQHSNVFPHLPGKLLCIAVACVRACMDEWVMVLVGSSQDMQCELVFWQDWWKEGCKWMYLCNPYCVPIRTHL